jgi:hypothetical protein
MAGSGKTQSRWTATHARKIIDELDASGQSIAEFARLRNLDPERLRRWRVRLAPNSPEQSVRLVELVAHGSSPRSEIRVHCPTGHVIEVVGMELSATLDAIVTTLAKVSRC